MTKPTQDQIDRAADREPPELFTPPHAVGADVLQEIRAVADKLKKLEPCAAASIEGRSCVTADVRWCGRELERIAGRVEKRLQRLEAWSATSAVEAERDARRIARAETAAKELAAALATEPSRELVEALFRLRVTLATREQRAAFRAVERIVHRTPERAAPASTCERCGGGCVSRIGS